MALAPAVARALEHVDSVAVTMPHSQRLLLTSCVVELGECRNRGALRTCITLLEGIAGGGEEERYATTATLAAVCYLASRTAAALSGAAPVPMPRWFIASPGKVELSEATEKLRSVVQWVMVEVVDEDAKVRGMGSLAALVCLYGILECGGVVEGGREGRDLVDRLARKANVWDARGAVPVSRKLR